jgi:FkbM family methyltransferase
MKLIYDIGAHNGSDTEFYLKKGFQVIAIEPNPHSCHEIIKRLGSYLDSGQLILREYAVSDENELSLWIHKIHTDWASVNPNWNSKYPDEIEEILVDGCSMYTHYCMFGQDVYYVKIDVEGQDAMCIRQFKSMKLPQYMSAELLTPNNLVDGTANPLDVIHAFLEIGYTKFQIVDQGKNHLTKCSNPALEGEYVDYKFDGYCSGLFGKELPDKWVGVDEILLQYIHYFYGKPNCCGESLDQGSWFDLHTKL